MPDPHETKTSGLARRLVPARPPGPVDRAGRPGVWPAVSVAAAVALAALGLVAFAFAAQASLSVRRAKSAAVAGSIVVDRHGRTLYALAPENAHHLLCKSRACFRLWPPLTVSSRKVKLEAGPGVHGRLAILRRRSGMLQVMLRGMPLYRFAGDHGKGQVHGQGIASFGGTWHAVTVSAGSGKAPSASHPGSGARDGGAPGTRESGSPSGGGYEGTGSPGTTTASHSSTTTATFTTADTATGSTTVTTSSTTQSYGPGW